MYNKGTKRENQSLNRHSCNSLQTQATAVTARRDGQTKKEVKTMAARKSQGYYTFADGTRIWFFGLSAQEKKIEVLKHGSIIKFEATK